MREIKHLSIHQWLRSAIPDSQQPTSPIGFLFLKLPPPPCAVLLVLALVTFVFLPFGRSLWQSALAYRVDAAVTPENLKMASDFISKIQEVTKLSLAKYASQAPLMINEGFQEANLQARYPIQTLLMKASRKLT